MALNNAQLTTIEYCVNGKKVKFKVLHNLPEDFGLSIQNAFESWVHRTNDHSAESFCEYINDKVMGSQYAAMPV